MAEDNTSDNKTGIILALSSSFFIGASFIIKKKGLIRARAAGAGGSAAGGGHAYLRESMWWIGLVTMILGEIANFAAYAYAPAILVTPLGALSVIISAILASLLLKERLLVLGKVGCALCIVGSTVIVLNAPAEEDINSVDQMIEQMTTNIAFQLYCFFVFVFSVILVYYVVPRIGETNILVYVTICSVVGSISVIACKGLGIAIKLSLAGNNQMRNSGTWIFALLVAVSIVTQMNYLNKALDTFNTAIVTPIYYVIFTTATIVASAILFRGWSNPTPVLPDDCPAATSSFGASHFLSVLCGFFTICTGVFILHLGREHSDALPTRDPASIPTSSKEDDHRLMNSES